MSKCCCQQSIDSSKNQILTALSNQKPVIPQSIPPFQRTRGDTEEIARRVADELYKTEDSFKRDTQRQLDAIVNALIGLKSRPDLAPLLNQIIRNQNDQFDLMKEYQRQIQFNFDKVATKEQAKDLLLAIASLRRDMLEQFRFSAREISNRFAAIGRSLVELATNQRLAFLAQTAATIAQTATILNAIRNIRFPTQPAGGNSDILPLLQEILDKQLSLKPITTSVPVCVNVPGVGASIQSQSVPGYAIENKSGNSTATYQESVADMLFNLLKSGQLNCSKSITLTQQVIAEIDGSSSDSTVPVVCFPSEVDALYFVIQITEINPKFIRTYKLAGSQSEYGLGNWAIVDSAQRVSGDFVRLFNRSQRITPPTELSGAGVRLSLKAGISATVVAWGYSNR